MTALQREFGEETGLLVEVGELRGVLSDVITLPNGTLLHTVRIIYRIDSWSGQLRDETHGSSDAARWHRLDEVSDLPLAPYVARAARPSCADHRLSGADPPSWARGAGSEGPATLWTGGQNDSGLQDFL